MTTPGSLDQQLKQRLAATGHLTSADLAAAVSGAAMEQQAPAAPVGDVKVTEPATKYDEPLVPLKSPSLGGDTLAADADTGMRGPDDAAVTDEPIEVEVTEDERTAFLNAIVSNERYTRPFSLFNGRITGVLRSRTQAETRAIISQLQREIHEHKIETDADYVLRLRSMLFAAQVQMYGGVVNPELAEPLWWTRQPDGAAKEPGWLQQAAGWQNLDEALATVVYEEIRKFEVKYWMMARHAGDQNFWQTAAST